MNIKDTIKKHKHRLVVILVLLVALLAYLIDLSFEGKFFELIGSFAISKIATIFFTIGGVVSLFLPFSFRKEISEKDISSISKKAIETTNSENKRNKMLEDQSTF
jgi:hypothetical protein